MISCPILIQITYCKNWTEEGLGTRPRVCMSYYMCDHFLSLVAGKQFRTDFAHMGEIRSLIPRKTNLMALTATANLATRKMIICSLEMHGCYIKAQNPNKRNIQYIVAEKPHDLMKMIRPIVCHVRERGQEADRYIIFCWTYNDNSEIFELLVLELADSGLLITATAVWAEGASVWKVYSSFLSTLYYGKKDIWPAFRKCSFSQFVWAFNSELHPSLFRWGWRNIMRVCYPNPMQQLLLGYSCVLDWLIGLLQT